MRLYGSQRSPFARKVTLAAHELGLHDSLELVPTVVATTSANPALLPLHPLGQIPTLVLADGTVIADSLVICEWLDDQATPPRLFPARQPVRAQALTRHAMAQGMTESLVRLFGERKRSADPLSAQYADAFRAKFHRGAAWMEARIGARAGQPVDIGDIGWACVLAYAAFRFAEEDWRTPCPALAAWFDDFAQRPSMGATTFSAEPG